MIWSLVWLLSVSLALGTILYLYRWIIPSQYDFPDIPTIGYSGPLSFISAFRFFTQGHAMLQQGYETYKGGVFKVPELSHWRVMVSGPKFVEELRTAGDEMSFDEHIAEGLQLAYTFGYTTVSVPYHVPAIRTNLTRSLSLVFPGLHDEVIAAFAGFIPPSDDWAKVPALPTMLQVVSQLSGRVFVGLPLCRDAGYRELCVHFTLEVVKTAFILRLFPKILRPLMGRMMTSVSAEIRRAERYIQPIIAERKRLMEELGPGYEEGKPNDMLSWLMDAGEKRDVSSMTRRLMTVNIAAIHTTASSFTHALYELAANSEYVDILRDEVSRAVEQEGWQ